MTPPASDADLARLTWVNLLVVGPQDEVAKLVASIWPSLVRPILVRDRGEPLQLPPASSPIGTLVICDVETLTHEEQLALEQWLSAGHRRARVVSTGSESLMPLVEAGAFHDGLYYRLNVMTIDLTAAVVQ